MSYQNNVANAYRVDRLRTRDAAGRTYRATVGDELFEDYFYAPETVRKCQDALARVSGNLAYTPAIEEKILQVLERRVNTDIGNDVFVPPHYGPYEEPEMAAFYGIDTTMTDNLQTRKETHREQRDRIVAETIREVEIEMTGLAQQMELFRREDWPRHGVYDERPYFHADPDITLLRNPERGWSTLDRPVATSDKTNVIDLYEAQPEFVFPTPHPAWEVDRAGGFYYRLSKNNSFVNR